MRLGGGIKLPFKLLGIPVRLDYSFLLILPLFAYLIGSQLPAFVSQLRTLGLDIPGGELESGATPWLLGIIAALGLFTSVVIHELGHAVTARLYGVKTNEIRLWFLGGVAQFQELPSRRGAEAVIAIAGPVTSGLLALLLWYAVPLTGGATGATVVVAYLAITNVALAVFNLLPALPLDGGRVVRSLFALFLPHLRATNIAVALSAGIAIAMGVYGFLNGQLFLVIMAFFVYNAGRAEAQAAFLKDALEGLTARDLMTQEPLTVEPDMPLSQFQRLGEFRRHVGYPVVDPDNRLLGVALLHDVAGSDTDRPGDSVGEAAPGSRALAEANVVGETPAGAPRAALEATATTATANAAGTTAGTTPGTTEGKTVADITRPAETVAPDVGAMDAIHRLSAGEIGRLVVVNEAHKVLGVISKTDVVRFLSTRSQQHQTNRQRPR